MALEEAFVCSSSRPVNLEIKPPRSVLVNFGEVCGNLQFILRLQGYELPHIQLSYVDHLSSSVVSL